MSHLFVAGILIQINGIEWMEWERDVTPQVNYSHKKKLWVFWFWYSVLSVSDFAKKTEHTRVLSK